MDNTEDRIKKALEYFSSLKPSQFVSFGVVNPNRWRELEEFLKLVRLYVNGGEQKKLYEDETTKEN